MKRSGESTSNKAKIAKQSRLTNFFSPSGRFDKQTDTVTEKVSENDDTPRNNEVPNSKNVDVPLEKNVQNRTFKEEWCNILPSDRFDKQTDAVTEKVISENDDTPRKNEVPNSKNADVPLEKSVQKRKFKEEWCNILPWLDYNPNTGIAKCRTCNLFPDMADCNSKVVIGCSVPFKLETFKKHDKSYQHQKCASAEKALNSPESTPFATCLKKCDKSMLNHLKNIFNCAYYIAKNNKPFSDIESILELVKKLGVEMRTEYNNRIQCAVFVSYIAEVIRKEMISEIKNQKYVSLLLDASTDKGSVENVLLYLRYIKNYVVQDIFLSIIPLECATADGYFEAVKDELNNLGISELLNDNQLIGIGTDGAATMIGVENGFVQKVRQNLNHLIGIHCVAHRLQLSVLDVVKDIKSIDVINCVLKKLYKFYNSSCKRMRELKNISAILEEEILKLQYLQCVTTSVRWVASKVGALTALVKDWKPIIIHLETIAANEKGNAAAEAKGLLKNLKSFKFIQMTHFLLDFLIIVKKLSLIFQKEDIVISSVQLFVKKTVEDLSVLSTVPGHYEDIFIKNTSLEGKFKDIELTGFCESTKIQIEGIKKKLIDDASKYINQRFTIDENRVEMCTKIFDTFSWPSGKELQNFGIKEIKLLLNHFQKYFVTLNVDLETIESFALDEWYEFKVLCKDMKFSELLIKSMKNNSKFPILSKLLQIVSVIPVATASCERGFSTMNLIKNKFRSTLTSQNLNDLLLINLNGPSVEAFDPTKAVERWYFTSKTTRHMSGHKHKNLNANEDKQ